MQVNMVGERADEPGRYPDGVNYRGDRALPNKRGDDQ